MSKRSVLPPQRHALRLSKNGHQTGKSFISKLSCQFSDNLNYIPIDMQSICSKREGKANCNVLFSSSCKLNYGAKSKFEAFSNIRIK